MQRDRGEAASRHCNQAQTGPYVPGALTREDIYEDERRSGTVQAVKKQR